MMRTPRPARFLLLALLALLVAGAAGVTTRSAVAQAWPDQPPSLEARERLFQELAAAAAEFEERNVLKKCVRLVTPSVVHIDAQKGDGRRRSIEEAGSGVIIDFSGKHYVLTNRHVITGAAKANIDVKLADGRLLHPTKVWEHTDTDVAVMSIESENLTPARVGDSDKLEIGDFVLAVGSPFGLSHSVTYGIISAKGRRDLKLGEGNVSYQDFVQTDAAINPGNSGGPLLNLRGEVVGINTAIASSSGGSEGIGFTIPINVVMHVARQLVEKGVVVPAFLGVKLDSKFTLEAAIRMGLPTLMGARVSSVTADSAAEAAGLQTDDIILRFNGAKIENDIHLVERVGMTPAGKPVDMLVIRRGKPLTLRTRLTQGRPAGD